MTIEEKRDYLDDYCCGINCKECIFYRKNDACKYYFLDDEDCIKAYDELMEYRINKESGIMTIEEKRDYLNDYCNGTFCSECIFNDGTKSCKYDFGVASECEKAYDELMEYENQCKSNEESDTTYWEIDGYGILTADESMTKLIEFIIEKKLGHSDFHKAFLVNL